MTPTGGRRARFVSPPGLWHDASRELPLGCYRCPDFEVCGGLRTTTPIFDCTTLCSCTDPEICDMVCRKDMPRFVERAKEIRGWSLANVPRTERVPIGSLPTFVPLLFHGSRRSKPLHESVVALPLEGLVDATAGVLRLASRQDVARHFAIAADSEIVLSGVAQDKSIERWWKSPYRAKLIELLNTLRPLLVTSPNFSAFTDVPRWDNLHSMKRIALAFSEFAGAGVPTALHINGRTDRDYERWGAFVAERAEIEQISFEFGTGAGWPGRIDWHIEQLCKFARIVDRPVTLVARGGIHKLAELRAAFYHVVYVDTQAFSRTMHRQRAHVKDRGRLTWRLERTDRGDSLDGLLQTNIAMVRSRASAAVLSSQGNRLLDSSRQSTQHRDDKSRQRRLL